MKKSTFWICISIYAIITLIRIFNHQTWYDEAKAWLIAEHLNLFEIFDLMKVEGHTFVWYVLLMPFAKTHFAYPYSMLILNWIFCISSVIVMWIYAPFNKLLKILITFSSPFFVLYAIIARCYAIGILLLFILAAMYKDKLKHPYIYAILIFLCANTSVMAAIGAFPLGLMLFYSIIKEKEYKKLIGCGLTGLSCVIILLLQLYNANPIYALPQMLVGLSKDFFLDLFIFPKLINFILLILLIPSLLFLFFKNKESFFFLCSTYTMMLLVFNFIYLGCYWHHFFFFVYLLTASWIYLNDETIQQKYKKLLTIILIIISFFYCIDFRHRNGVFHSGSKILAEKIINLKDSNIIFVGKRFYQLLPYLYGKNVDYYYSHTFDKIKNPIKVETTMTDIINFDVIYKIFDKHKNTYLLIYDKNNKLSDFELKKNNLVLNFNLIEFYGKCVYIYKVEKIR